MLFSSFSPNTKLIGSLRATLLFASRNLTPTLMFFLIFSGTSRLETDSSLTVHLSGSRAPAPFTDVSFSFVAFTFSSTLTLQDNRCAPEVLQILLSVALPHLWFKPPVDGLPTPSASTYEKTLSYFKLSCMSILILRSSVSYLFPSPSFKKKNKIIKKKKENFHSISFLHFL